MCAAHRWRRAAASVRCRSAERARRLLGVFQPFFEKRRAAFDGGRRVVQLVGESGGQFAERDHLLVVQAARCEEPGCDRASCGRGCDVISWTLANHRREIVARDRENLRRLLGDGIAGRIDQARVGKHAGDVTAAPFDELVPSGAAVDEDRDAARQQDEEARRPERPFALSTSPSFRWRSEPCAASHSSSSRGDAPSTLCSVRRSMRSVAGTGGRSRAVEAVTQGCYLSKSNGSREVFEAGPG